MAGVYDNLTGSILVDPRVGLPLGAVSCDFEGMSICWMLTGQYV